MTRHHPPAAAVARDDQPPSSLSTPTLTWVRTREGTVHRPDCLFRGDTARPWTALTGLSMTKVLARLAGDEWTHPCGRCLNPQAPPRRHAAEIAGQLALGDALRETGQAAADRAQPVEWRAAVDREIARLAAAGEPFVADQVSAVVGDSPTGSRGAMGARFQHAARRGVIRTVGYARSSRASVRGHHVTQWQGAST